MIKEQHIVHLYTDSWEVIYDQLPLNKKIFFEWHEENKKRYEVLCVILYTKKNKKGPTQEFFV